MWSYSSCEVRMTFKTGWTTCISPQASKPTKYGWLRRLLLLTGTICETREVPGLIRAQQSSPRRCDWLGSKNSLLKLLFYWIPKLQFCTSSYFLQYTTRYYRSSLCGTNTTNMSRYKHKLQSARHPHTSDVSTSVWEFFFCFRSNPDFFFILFFFDEYIQSQWPARAKINLNQ